MLMAYTLSIMVTGHELREARKRLGLKQPEVARQLGRSLRTYARWEGNRDAVVPEQDRATMDRIRAFIDRATHDDPDPPISRATEMQLILELARRNASRTGTSLPLDTPEDIDVPYPSVRYE